MGEINLPAPYPYMCTLYLWCVMQCHTSNSNLSNEYKQTWNIFLLTFRCCKTFLFNFFNNPGVKVSVYSNEPNFYDIHISNIFEILQWMLHINWVFYNTYVYHLVLFTPIWHCLINCTDSFMKINIFSRIYLHILRITKPILCML